MLRSKCLSLGPVLSRSLTATGIGVLLVGMAGCSADVDRFSRPMLGAGDETTTGSIRRSDDMTMSLSEQSPRSDYRIDGVSRPSSSVERRPLPYAGSETSQPILPSAATNEPYARPTPPIASEPAPARSYRVADASPFASDTSPSPAHAGNAVTVQSGDTLYGIARRHGVSVAALKQANGLSDNTIRVGQTLAMPGQGSGAGYATPTRPVSGYAAPSYREPAPSLRETAPVAGGDSYTVQPGDSLYKISRQTGVPVETLQQTNGISDVRSLRPGQVLSLARQSDAPASSVVSREPASNYGRRPQSPRTQVAARMPSDTRSDVPVTSVGAEVINRPTAGRMTPPATVSRPVVENRKVASVAPDSRAPSPAGVDDARFRWPARGRIVTPFGPRKDGSHNDGIDISVPFGSDIQAAEAGVVAYADSELQAYGNLVLIRHDNGWVSAYAHANEILVKRGDRVERGQVIAKAGTTGSVEQPTVHFELRDGAKPVDPLPLLPRS